MVVDGMKIEIFYEEFMRKHLNGLIFKLIANTSRKMSDVRKLTRNAM